MKTISFAVISVLLSSCMHLGMNGMMERPESTADSNGKSIRIEKEVLMEGIRAVVTVPPLWQGRESLITLSLTNDTTQDPISGKRLSFLVSFRHEGEPLANHLLSGTTHDINDERVVNEIGRGSFEIPFTPSVPGHHIFRFYVSDPAENSPFGEKTIEVTAVVVQQDKMTPGAGMHGGGGMSTALIVGGVAMGAMMIVFWLSNGHVF